MSSQMIDAILAAEQAINEQLVAAKATADERIAQAKQQAEETVATMMKTAIEQSRQRLRDIEQTNVAVYTRRNQEADAAIARLQAQVSARETEGVAAVFKTILGSQTGVTGWQK